MRNFLLVFFLMIVTGCGGGGSDSGPPPAASNPAPILEEIFAFNFDTQENWQTIFVGSVESSTRVETLPAPAESQTGLYISGRNPSAEGIILLAKKQLTGLSPGHTYDIEFDLIIGTNQPSGCVTLGGALGPEGVVFRAGLVQTEPVQTSSGVSIDIGQSQNAGADVVLLGDVTSSQTCDVSPLLYELKNLNNSGSQYRATADSNGNLWLAFAVHSFGPVATEFYLVDAEVFFNP